MEAPRMRAGDADRARVVERLGRHLGEGRLTVPEFDERVTCAYAAVYLDELPPLTADLPDDPPPAVGKAPLPRRPAALAWGRPAVVQLLLVLIALWSVAAIASGVPPVLPLLLGFLLLRQRRWRGHP